MRLPGTRRRRKRTRGQEANTEQFSRISLLWVLVFVILSAVVPYFLSDALGRPYRLWGSVFWLMWVLVSFLAGLFYYSQFLLPLHWFFSWYEGVRLTIRYNFPFLVELVRWFFIRPKNTGATPNAVDDLPPGFTRHKAGIIRSHQAPVIFKGASFVQGARPGFLRLKQGQLVVEVIDLRRQFRGMSVEVLTRDGITLKTSVSTIFQVKQMENPPDEKWQFPFEQDAIFQVNYLGNFKLEEDEVMSWADRVPRQAASALIGEVSRYSLDELFQLDESRAAPLEIIKEKITKSLKKAFEKYGIVILTVGVTPLMVPEDVRAERVALWKAEWEQRIDVEMGSAQAERQRRLKLARARAQIEMIERLTDGLETIRQTGQDVTDILSLRLIEAIEEAESNAATRALIPAQIVHDLQSLRNHVLGEGQK